MPPTSARVAGWSGIGGAIIILLAAPFHAAASFATEDGSQDLFPYQVKGGAALRDAFPALYDGDPYETYRGFGRATSIGFALFAAAFVAWHRTASEALTAGWRRVGLAACITWSITGVAAMLEYFTPFTEELFLVAGPALLLSLVLTGVYSAMRARRHVGPPGTAWPIFAATLAFIPLVALFGHIPMAGYGFALAWLVAGPRLLERNA